MNSQQELLDAINTISQKQDKSFDTPATVLRVDEDTVWVHIDGGADETPVRKTINCEQGETVQVRIANGSAFLVGNASAPPTDDKTANVAHFVAVEADAKATEAIKSVEAISQTVEGKVDSGDSNVSVLSSTMYQNANGVNIFNNTLAVGDSYAHIDGDSFDIKQATTAGIIDDANDEVLASFGQSVVLGKETGCHISIDDQTISVYDDTFNVVNMSVYGVVAGLPSTTWASMNQYGFGSDHKTGMTTGEHTSVDYEGVFINKSWTDSGNTVYENITLNTEGLIGNNVGIYYDDGESQLPGIQTSSDISASQTSYTFIDPRIHTDGTFDIYDTIFGFAPTGMTVSEGSCTITFPAQGSSHKIRLFIYGWNKSDFS